MRRQEQSNIIYVHNNDGLLDVPASLLPKKKGRMLKMVTLTPADKIKAKIMLNEAKAAKNTEIQERLQQELKEAEEQAMMDDQQELSIK